MSLTKLFNKNYFVQNILKSKAVMALVIGIIPILNAIFLMAMESTVSGKYVVSLSEISILNIFGMYVLPIILSLCLFGYIFNKKSVDFVNSMPLTRKTIYVTNSIGGILLIIAMMLINTILLLIESLMFSNLIIPFAMILDYFIVWTIAYIFVFTVANVATSISGNHVTMLVTSMVLLFFIPFMHNYITGFNGQLHSSTYYVVDTVEMGTQTTTADWAVEKVTKDVDYTLPYNYISWIFKGHVPVYSAESNIKMIALSIIYFVLGMIAFERRKMEINETSFKSDNAHMILKSLTLLVIGVFAMILINQTSTFMNKAFIIGLIVAYYFIYDVITTKTIRNIKLGLVYFVATALISVGLYYGVEHLNDNTKYKALNPEDISAVALYIDEIEYSDRYYNSKMIDTYLDNEELLKIVRENMSKPQEYSQYYMHIRLKLNNNDKYDTYIYLNLEEYNNMVNIAVKDEKYLNEYRNIDYEDIYSMTLDGVTLIGDELQKELDSLKNIIDEANLKDAYIIPNTYTTIDLSVYSNHESKNYSIPINISKELFEKYVEAMNNKTLKYKNNVFLVTDVEIFNYDEKISNDYEKVSENDVHKYLREYIKNSNNEIVDVTKPLMKIRGGVNVVNSTTNKIEFIELEYFTNNVLEYMNFVNNIAN